MPPNHWVMLRKKRIPWATPSMSARIVAPVQVNPEIDSNSALSASLQAITPLNRYGIVPAIETASHAHATAANASGESARSDAVVLRYMALPTPAVIAAEAASASAPPPPSMSATTAEIPMPIPTNINATPLMCTGVDSKRRPAQSERRLAESLIALSRREAGAGATAHAEPQPPPDRPQRSAPQPRRSPTCVRTASAAPP